MAELHTRLQDARRPLVIVGGTGWDCAASAALAHFVERNDLPVAASFRRQDLFDNRSRHYVGQLGLGVSPRLAERVREGDLLLRAGNFERALERFTRAAALCPGEAELQAALLERAQAGSSLAGGWSTRSVRSKKPRARIRPGR